MRASELCQLPAAFCDSRATGTPPSQERHFIVAMMPSLYPSDAACCGCVRPTVRLSLRTLQQRRLAGCARRTESRGFHHDLECLRRTSGVYSWSMDAPFFISRARMGHTLFHLPCQDGEFNRDEFLSPLAKASCSFARRSVAALSLASSTAISPVSVSIIVEHSLIMAVSSTIS